MGFEFNVCSNVINDLGEAKDAWIIENGKNPTKIFLPYEIRQLFISECQAVSCIGTHPDDTISEFEGMLVFGYDGNEIVFAV